MNWSNVWPWRWVHGKKLPARRQPTTAQLAVEALEDRIVPASSTSAAALAAWKAQTFTVNDTVVRTVPSNVVTSAVTQTVAVPANASFGSMIGLPSVFANTPYRGQGYSVAVIDTGIDYLDPSLGGSFGPGYKVEAGWNFVNNSANVMDDNGHGSVVANEIAGSDPTYSGVAPGANLIALKVLDASGSGTFGNVLAALDWVVANRAKYNIAAVNLSLGAGNYTSNPYTYLDADFSNLVNNGVTIAVAAGNDYYVDNSQQGLDYPAVDPLVVSVGAVYDGNFGAMAWANGARDYTTGVDHIASFSQRGPGLSILAPGAMVSAYGLNNQLVSMAGTSMAAPVIAGASIIIHQALDAAHRTANESTILSIMQKTGVSDVDSSSINNDNVVNTGLTFKRIDLAAAVNSIGAAVQPPTLAAIPNQSVSPGGTLNVTLNGNNPTGGTLTYSATVAGGAASTAYQLEQQLGLRFMNSYYTNIWGQNEKWLASNSGYWYCILPDGELRRWTGSMATTLQPANLVATLDPSFYGDPSLLWNAQPTATLAVSVKGNQLTIQAPASATGSFQVTVTASNGTQSVSQTFTVSIQTPLTIAKIPNQTMAAGSSLGLTLSGSSNLVYSATVVNNAGAGSSQAYQLQQQLQLKYMGSYFTNSWGQNEKWMSSASGTWYCILPNGQLRRWTGSMATTLQPANLIATLSAGVYADPSLLWNAKATVAPTVTISGAKLTIQAPAGVTGTFQIQVTGTSGGQTATQTFTVTIK
jgi:hypothetical protein